MLAYGRARRAVSQKLYREKITSRIPKVPHVYLRLKWLQFYRGVGGTPGNSWWGPAARFSKSWHYFRPKNVIFSTHFHACRLKSIPVFRFGLYEIMSSLLRLEHQRKRFLSLLFNTETMNTFIHYRRFLETRTRFQTRPFGTAHHSKWLIYGCTPPPPREFQKSVTATFSHDPLRFQNFVFNSPQTYNCPKGIQWENCFCKSCVFGGKDKEKCIMGNVEVGRGGGGGNGFTTSEWLYWLLIAWVTVLRQVKHKRLIY